MLQITTASNEYNFGNSRPRVVYSESDLKVPIACLKCMTQSALMAQLPQMS